MESRDLLCFCRVYEEKGINKAARQLFISSQGLSKTIARLEQELDVQLFERNKQGMQATACADLLYKKAQRLMLELEQLQIELNQVKQNTRQLKIGFATGAFNALQTFDMEKLQTLFPDTRLQFFEDENQIVLSRLVKGDLDLAFVVGTAADSRMEAIRVFHNQLAVVVYEGHPWYERESILTKELKDMPLISLNERYYAYHSLQQRAAEEQFIPNIVFQVMEPSMIERLVSRRAGIGIDVCMKKQSMPGIRYIPLTDSIPWNVYAILPKDSRKIQEAKILCKYICQGYPS